MDPTDPRGATPPVSETVATRQYWIAEEEEKEKEEEKEEEHSKEYDEHPETLEAFATKSADPRTPQSPKTPDISAETGEDSALHNPQHQQTSPKTSAAEFGDPQLKTPPGPDTSETPATADSSPDQKSVDSPRKAEARSRVSIQTEPDVPAPKPPTSGRRRMERELTRMKEKDENERLRYKARRKKEVKKAIEALHEERSKKGVTLTNDVEVSRNAIRTILREEDRMALAKEQKKLRSETQALQQQIQAKYSLKDRVPTQDLLTLAQDFYHDKVKDKDGIPEHVRRELTSQEIEDLRMVFDMFDVKGKGYITSDDVRRAAGMLGFKAKKEVFSAMIEEVTGDKRGRVTFSNFLQFVVKGQGDGDDPLDDILQCFGMLDRDQKGYITAADVRHAADSQKLPLSNRAIREMIQEADISGDAQVTSDEFIHLMLQSSMFRTTH